MRARYECQQLVGIDEMTPIAQANILMCYCIVLKDKYKMSAVGIVVCVILGLFLPPIQGFEDGDVGKNVSIFIKAHFKIEDLHIGIVYTICNTFNQNKILD